MKIKQVLLSFCDNFKCDLLLCCTKHCIVNAYVLLTNDSVQIVLNMFC